MSNTRFPRLKSSTCLPSRPGKAALLAVFTLCATRAWAVDYTVNTGSDAGSYLTGVGSGTTGDLRYCIARANANPGSTITIEGQAVMLNTELPPITAPMLIQAVNGTSISGQNACRIFFIDAPGATVTIQNILLRDAKAKGGNGGLGCGGGGMGAGAAIFVNAGNAVCNNIRVQNVAVQGGNGGATDGGASGGGGGLSGNGGLNYGGGGGFRGPGGNGANVTGGVAGIASGGGGGIDGRGADGGQHGGGGGGGTTNGNGRTGGGGGGNGGTNYTAKNGLDGTTYGGGGGAGTGGYGSALGGSGGRFGGGGGGSSNTNSNGGNGGEFGGGGGAAFTDAGPNPGAKGGNGGYGAGGGGGLSPGSAGFGGGNGGRSVNQYTTGGGGSAYGAAVFVRSANGATLRTMNVSLPSGTLTPGAPGAVTPATSELSGAPGQAAGSSVYFNGNGGDFDVTTNDADYSIDGTIVCDGNVGLQKNGLRTLTLTAPNDYRGTTVNYGTLKLSGAGTLGNPGWFLATYLSGTCDLNGTNQTVGPIFGTNGGQIVNDATGTVATLTVGHGDANGDFEGYLRDGLGKLGLRKIGSGTQILRHANTHTGPTEVLGGTLVLDTGFSFGPLIPAGSTLTISNGAVRLSGTSSNALGQGPIVIKSGGVLSAENAGSAVHHLGPLTLQGGTVAGGNPDSGLPTLIIANDVTANGNAASSISPPFAQLLGVRTFDVADGTAAADLTVSSLLVDHNLYPGGILKTGSGTLLLTSRNTYTAGTTINGGVLSAGIGGFTGPFAAGSTVTVNNGGVLRCSAGDCLGYFDGNAKLVINTGGTVTTNGAADMTNWLHDLTLNGGTLTSPATGGGFLLAGPVKTQASSVTSVISAKAVAIYPGYAAPVSFDVPTGSAPGGIDLRVDSPIGGGGGEPLIKKGTGIMLLTSANTYQGGTRLEGGTLAISNASALGSGPIQFALGALRFDGIAPDVSARIQPPASSAFPIRINTNGQNVTFASPLSGPAPLGKSGAGTLTLAAVCTYTGGTNVNAGTVAVAATGRLGTGTINIAAGATLDFRAFGSAGYPMPAGTVINNNGTILGGYYYQGSLPDIAAETSTGLALGTGAILSYSQQQPGATELKAFTLRNTGTGLLQITGVTLTGPNASEFQLNLTTMATTLATNAGANSTTFSVTFAPLTTGSKTAPLRITSNDPDESPIDLTLTGTGYLPPKISVEIPAGTAFGQQQPVAWGSNDNAQLNIPATASSVIQLSSGRWHTLALNADNTVAAWGYNGDNQISIPTDLGPATAVAAGAYHSIGLRQNGTVKAWGLNSQGQCNVPGGLDFIVSVAAGPFNSAAVRSDGRVFVWGNNAENVNNVPAGLTGVKSVVLGLSHAAALRTDGTVVAWGRIVENQASVPAGLTGVVALAAGNDHTLALKADGTVVAWGWQGDGRLDVPAGLSGVKAIAAGGSHSVALKSDGTVVAWGLNSSGQTTVPGSATGVSAISAGWEFTVASRTRYLEFGDQPLGNSSGRTVFIRNTGGQPLTLSGISLKGLHPSDFTTSATGQLFSVPPGGQTSFSVTFQPQATGPRLAGLSIVTNDPASLTYTLPLRGTGLENPLALWRQTWFGTTANAGNAANDFDYDKDGLTNLMEFAFGLNPTSPASAALPAPVNNGTTVSYTFTAPQDALDSGLQYIAEYSTDGIAWINLPNTGTGSQFNFTLPLDDRPRLFTRLRIAASP